MRVAHLAAGAGGMYCGSCLRDNRVAATLIAAGRDVILVPLYTPLRTDESDVSLDRVYYGGINVYLDQVLGFWRHAPTVARSLLDSRRLLRWAGKLASRTNPRDLGPLTVSVLGGEHGAQRRELTRLVDALASMKVDLVSLPNLMFVGIVGPIKEQLRVPVVCTLGGEDVFLDELPSPYKWQALDRIRSAVREVDGFISLTAYYARHATDCFGLPEGRIHVIPMGVRTDAIPERVAPPSPPFVVSYVGRICRAKGLMNACAALAQLRSAGRDVCLRAGGFLSAADRGYFRDVQSFVRASGIGNAFEYVGEMSWDEKISLLHSSHAFTLPTVYHEAKGFPVLEAMACGIPVVQPAHGSFPELINATRGGLLYDPSEPNGLADAVARLMDDPEWATDLARNGRRGVIASFNENLMADRTWDLYADVCRHP